jgi:hypothetical protein
VAAASAHLHYIPRAHRVGLDLRHEDMAVEGEETVTTADDPTLGAGARRPADIGAAAGAIRAGALDRHHHDGAVLEVPPGETVRREGPGPEVVGEGVRAMIASARGVAAAAGAGLMVTGDDDSSKAYVMGTCVRRVTSCAEVGALVRVASTAG